MNEITDQQMIRDAISGDDFSRRAASETNETRAQELCRKSEAAFRAGDREAALADTRTARLLAPNSAVVASFASWLFSETQHRPEAIAALQVLHACEQASPEQERSLSGLLAAEGAFDGSIAHALHAANAMPDNAEFARHCGMVLNFVGRSVEATEYLIRSARRHNKDPLVYFQLSAACWAMNRKNEAIVFAAEAVTLDPGNESYIKTYATYLLQCARGDEAVEALELYLGLGTSASPDIWFLTSLAYSETKDYDKALSAATAGLTLFGDHPELLMQRGAVSCCLGLYAEAIVDMNAVLRLDPGNIPAKRARFAATTEAGRYLDAIPIGADLLLNDPDDEQIGRSMLHILTRRFLSGGVSQLDGAGLAAIKREHAHLKRRRVEFTISQAFFAQLRVIGALILREMRGRFGNAKLGYLWALFEPLMHISLLVLIIQTMSKGSPPIGDNYALFYFTGIIPYHLFTHTATQLMGAIRGNRSLLQLPPVTTLDVLVSRALLELGTELMVAVILMGIFLVFSINALPYDPPRFFLALGVIWLFAFGVGVCNAVLVAYFHSWEKLWATAMAIMYFTSGIFYVPSMMPVSIREYLVWNPILQGIEMFRSSMFRDHEPQWLDIPYMVVFSVSIAVIGIVAERVCRRKLLELE